MDTNFTAYVAVGTRHHFLLAGGDAWLDRMWLVVDRAINAVLRRQQPSGAVSWRADPEIRLVAGCSSIHHALPQALALASLKGLDRPQWRDAAHRLRVALLGEPRLFAAKPHAMDWYYPVLGSVVTGADATARLAAGWDRFVEPGLGVRCVHHEPWGDLRGLRGKPREW
ncbi:hypothetical protein H074_08735 [Amycolatopsis decaplanina DSM 44594]|uniref:Uncharacterized protein n=2 Tax=Amycolatopsis decaplanina TaxID=208441 RepID=M2XLT0_9PSEU|nr:hypothetical protein H074_08735 [Amycolatopsis decaplanina DSM 44594]